MVDPLTIGVRVTYQMVLPVLVVLGVLGSLICMYVLCQPNLKKYKVNRYFLVLTASDLFLCIFYIPIITSAVGCEFPDYGSAWFFAHFGWTVPCTFHAIGTYVIIILSLDRFVGVWFPTFFKRLQTSPFSMRNKIIFITVLSVGLHVTYTIDAEVVCLDESQTIYNCTEGYMSNDGYQKSFDQEWHRIYRFCYSLLVRWIPSVLLVFFNIGLVLSLLFRRVNFPKTAGKRRVTRRSDRVLVMTMIAMTASYTIFTLPITIFLTFYAEHTVDRCTISSPEETLRHSGNTLQLFEHVLHVAFLVLINPRFRNELLKVIHCREMKPGEADTTNPDDQSSKPTSSRPQNTDTSQPVSTPLPLEEPSTPRFINDHSTPCLNRDSPTPRIVGYHSTSQQNGNSSTPRLNRYSPTPEILDDSSTPCLNKKSQTPRLNRRDLSTESLDEISY